LFVRNPAGLVPAQSCLGGSASLRQRFGKQPCQQRGDLAPALLREQQVLAYLDLDELQPRSRPWRNAV